MALYLKLGEQPTANRGARCQDSNIFKVRYGNHKTSFKYSAKRVNTSLAGHVWRLKDGNHPFNIKWRTLATYPDYNPSTNSCRLCLMEKFTIMCKPELATINQRDKFFTPYLHKQAKLLDNAVT